jgi:hypothetical protein
MVVRAPTLLVGAFPRIGTMVSARRSAFVLLFALALWLGLAGPTARAAELPRPTVAAMAVLADGWSWSEFVKFWQRQAAATSGVMGIVLLVGAVAVLLILSKAR